MGRIRIDSDVAWKTTQAYLIAVFGVEVLAAILAFQLWLSAACLIAAGTGWIVLYKFMEGVKTRWASSPPSQ